MSERVVCKVKFYDFAKSFGFAVPESGGKDIFIHASRIEQGFVPKAEDKVSLEIEDTEKGLRGKAIRREL